MVPFWMLLTACTADPLAYEGVQVEEAWMENVRLSTVALILGVVRGAGDLIVVSPDGQRVEGPVVIRGVTAGLSVDMILTEFPLGEVPLQLPRGEVLGEELLGRYRGTSASLVSGIGVETHHLANEYEVEIDQAFLALGVGVMFGYEAFTIHPGEYAEDTGGSSDTGDTGDTGAP